MTALKEDREMYRTGDPYPHIVFNDFLPVSVAKDACSFFPEVGDEGWIHYIHWNEKKHGLNRYELLPVQIQQLISELNGPDFVNYLSKLTGIPNLLADNTLEGGGLHQTPRNGFLNVHADFTVHPHKRFWKRKVNLLIYLNENWEDDYGGFLELWSRDMKSCVKSISPVFNRCVIFNTDFDSFHGVPDPIQCPEDMTRKSLALYYYTNEEVAPRRKATNYQARPGEGMNRLWVYLDKRAIAVYTSIKGIFGIDDRWVSKILSLFNRKKSN